MSRPPFVMVRNELWADPEITAAAKLLWMSIDATCEWATSMRATSSELGAMIGVGWRQAIRLAAELVDRGWLRVDPAGRRGNTYTPLRRARFDDPHRVHKPVDKVGTTASWRW